MPTSTVPLMKPCSEMILQLKRNSCMKPAQDFPAPVSYNYYLSFFFKYRTLLTASQCIDSALIGGKGSPQEMGASAIFTSTGSPPKGRTAFWVEMFTDVFGPPSKCRCNFCPHTAFSQGILIVPCPRPSCVTVPSPTVI